jgi:hypothetical protein
LLGELDVIHGRPSAPDLERGLSRGSDLSMLLAPLRPGYGPTRAPVQTMIII